MKPDKVHPVNGHLPEAIDFRELPSSTGFSNLYLDYLYDYERVGSYFPTNFRSDEAFHPLMERVRERKVDRVLLSSVLERQNLAFGAQTKALTNVRLLSKETTFAVVTGQQVGLFGGPMYTLYKTLTCLQTAAALKTRFPKYDFVPVFWLEGEDHDFQEVSRVNVLDRGGAPVRLEYSGDPRTQARNSGPAGDVILTDSIEEVFRTLEQSLLPTEFTADTLSSLRKSYSEGRTLLHAFATWLNHLFDDSGLLFLNPSEPELKRELTPLFEREIRDYPATSQLVVRQSADLEERYHAQVKPKSINLFLLHKGGRYLIEPRETDFSLKGTRQYFPKEELGVILHQNPERFSPNVVLRPIVQDYLLPTVAYIGGPSEVAYQAQLSLVYEHFGVVQPVIIPRASATFIEDRVDRVAGKYQLPAVRLFEDPEVVTREILQQLGGVNIDALFRTAGESVENMMAELTFGLTEIDATLKGPLEGGRSKIEGALRGLKEKSLAAQKRRNETAVRQIERALQTVMPAGNLQERELNIVYYLNKYGPDVVRWLSTELRVDLFKHQLLTV
ncbi:MAG: bacillithiol biosynthesis cysteine-adding enzyme BshC [Ignavibacteria bacterium]|nr:bacillithiol biosynthesis cysteine-adding enzyme BshC [Ignavibacteria bacterium]